MKIKRAVSFVLIFLIAAMSLNAAAFADETRRIIFTNEPTGIVKLDIQKTLADSEYPAPVDDEFTFMLYLGKSGESKLPTVSDREYRVYDKNNLGKEIFRLTPIEYTDDGFPIFADEVIYTTDAEKANDKVNYRNEKFTTSDGMFTLRAGWVASFENVSPGLAYKVVELDTENYQLDSSVNTSNVISKTENNLAEFVNVYSPPDDGKGETAVIQVKKNLALSGDYENPDRLKEFRFFIELDGEPYASHEYHLKGSENPLFTDDQGGFMLMADQTAVFEEIPMGAAYRISEKNESGWWVCGSGIENDEETNRSVFSDEVDSKNEYVSFTNSRYSFAVSKYVTNTANDDTEFTFELTNKIGGAISPYGEYYLYDSNRNLVSDAEQPLRTVKGRFTLKSGQTAVFLGIAPQTVYNVTEVDIPVDYCQTMPENNGNYANQTVDGEEFRIHRFENEYISMEGLFVSKSLNDPYGLAEDDAEYTFVLEKLEGEEYKPLTVWESTREGNYLYPNKQSFRIDAEGKFTLKAGQTACFNRLIEGRSYRVREVNPNGDEHLFYTSVMTGDEEKLFNENSVMDEDPVSEGVEYVKGESPKISFTNSTIPSEYLLRVQKLIYVDTGLRENDSSQTFVFRIEHYADEEDMMAGINVLDTYYTDIRCENDSFDGDDCQVLSADSGKIVTEKYSYPYKRFEGSRVVSVNQRGWYKITEVTDWSGTDYDYLAGSNTFIGAVTAAKYHDDYLNNSSNGSYVAFSIDDTYLRDMKIDELPGGQFTNIESPYAFRSDQDYAENNIRKMN